MRHHRLGAPERVLRAALKALAADGLDGGGMDAEGMHGGERVLLLAASPIVATPPLGPSRRRYANAAAVIACALDPEAMLAHLQRIERAFGRRRRGRRWAARVLDLDIVLWSGGAFVCDRLTIPHVGFRRRRFVLDPAARIAGDWRDPLSGLGVRHLAARLTSSQPVRTSSQPEARGP